MRNRRMIYLGIIVVAAFGSVQAQPSGEGTATVDVGGASVDAKLTPQEMQGRAGSLFGEMESTQARLLSLQEQARQSRDIIKLNCVNDKLLQVKQLLNIADAARANLTASIAARDDGARYHQFAVITVSAEKTAALRDEAEACIGEELVFQGRASVDVDSPDVPDDPTSTDPFSLATSEFDLERPAYATPFL